MSQSKSLLALIALVLAAAACTLPGVPGASGDGSLFKDDFSSKSSGWGTGTDADSSVEYNGGALQMQIFKDNFFVWSSPSDDKYDDVHIEVTVKKQSADTTGTFGIMCDQQVTDSAHYYFAISPKGDYAIVKAAVAKDDVFLSGNGDWATSDQITPHAKSYRMGADCGGDGTLALYVDGKQVAAVNDTSYKTGKVGLFAWSGDEKPSLLLFDDFSVKKIAAPGK